MSENKTAYRDINRQARVVQIPIEYDKRPTEQRVEDFCEIVIGFNDDTATLEASRCLQCPAPQACVLSCPAGNDIPEALWLISQHDFVGAAKVFAKTSPLPEVCGRVCPNLCQQGCVLGRQMGALTIGKLETFISDIARESGALAIETPEAQKDKHVAIVGSGPAGITVAEDLITNGYQVTIYEAWPKAGGVLVYGIPNFKLDKKVVQYKIKDLEEAGVNFVLNTTIGTDIMMEDLMEQYDAVFLGTGAGVEATMDIPGETLAGIYTSTDYLVRANVPTDMLPTDKRIIPDIGKKVAVVGGGDTAVDCARTSIRLGAEEVTIVYRRTEREMPGNKSERAICVEEGTNISYLQAPVEYIDDGTGRVKAVKVIKMELGEPDSSGRRRPIPIEGSEFEMEVDTVVLAVGYWPDPLIGKTTKKVATHKWGLIVTNPETGSTTHPGVFAAGDNVHGPDLVITAVAAAHTAADNIINYLEGNDIDLATPPPPRKRRS